MREGRNENVVWMSQNYSVTFDLQTWNKTSEFSFVVPVYCSFYLMNRVGTTSLPVLLISNSAAEIAHTSDRNFFNCLYPKCYHTCYYQ